MADAFERRTAANGVTYLACPALGVPHGFSTRLGGVSDGPYAGLNLGLSSGDDEAAVRANRARWAEALGLPAPFFTLHQVHGPVVYDLTADDATEPAAFQGDGIVTAAPGRAIGVFTADCAPILLAAPATGVVAAVHAGWRGTVAGVAAAAVATMAARHGVAPADLVAAIGPTIGPCCFEVGDEVVAALRAAPWAGMADAVVPRTPKAHADLFAANAAQLVAAGLRPENVHASRACTACDATSFYSWRRDAGTTGRLQAVIAARPMSAG
jgi:YfiH family protein